ncbi:WhiB family transcriptional regulator [Microbacterium sp. NPDC089180]|uniref:WhiB family transcriptional regulator n=1 Tax=unclassified Microbacterium TaxID=2609290 RepID=UPI003439033C
MTRNSPRLTEAARMLDVLTRAGIDTPPACDGDDTFIADRGTLVTADLTRMRVVCSRCPLIEPCGDYARTAKPEAGYWAGIAYGKPERAAAAKTA